MFNDSLKCCLLFKKAFNLWLFGLGVLFSFCFCFVLFCFCFFRKLSSNWKYSFKTCLLENR